jgi:hypothetical protein
MATSPQFDQASRKAAPAKKATKAKSAAVPAKPKKQAATGRPSSYRAEYAEWAEKLTKLGATDKELADSFDVVEATINNWKLAHPEFLESIKRGKAIADAEVASKLFHRATGYEHPEDDIKSVMGEIVITPTIKHYPPDTTAAIFWLKNRRPDLWRDKVEQEHSGPGGGAIAVHSTVTLVKPPEYPED